MVKRVYILLLLLLCGVGCSRSIEFDTHSIGSSSEVFIECYCRRGELYNLTATYLSPIDTPQSLDYSYQFEAYVTDTDERRLWQGLFFVDNVVYSHGSPERMPSDFDGELTLCVSSEYGDIFTATTSVPDEVGEFTAFISGQNVVVEFDTSADSAQNYYGVTITSTLEDGTSTYDTQLSSPSCNTTQRLTFDAGEALENGADIVVSLRRFTHEGFIYQQSLIENIASTSSNIIVGSPLLGNIEGALGIFTCYSLCEVQL